METFGEITEPSSRATWEDWDDIDNSSHEPDFQWENTLEIPEEVDNFFLFEGKYFWDGVLQEAKDNIQKINSIKEINVQLYKVLDTNNYICFVSGCDLMLSNNIVNLLRSFIVKSKTVAAMLVKPLSEFQTAQSIVHPYIIRKITTSNELNLMNVNYLKLEQPNIISGVSAGVFTLREHLGLSAAVVVFYIEHSHVYEIEDLQTLLQKLDLSQSGKVKQNPVLHSNLYI